MRSWIITKVKLRSLYDASGGLGGLHTPLHCYIIYISNLVQLVTPPMITKKGLHDPLFCVSLEQFQVLAHVAAEYCKNRSKRSLVISLNKTAPIPHLLSLYGAMAVGPLWKYFACSHSCSCKFVNIRNSNNNEQDRQTNLSVLCY